MPRRPILAPALLLALLIPTLLSAAPATAPATQPAIRTIHVAELPLKLDNATPEQREWLKPLQPPAGGSFDATLRDMPDDPEDGWRFVRAVYPSPLETPWPENNVVPAELYLPRKPSGKVPAAIVLDILDASAIVPRALARGLAENGVVAIYVPMACYGPRRPAHNDHIAYFNDHPEKTVENMRQTVMDIRRAKALLAALPQVDADRIAITGVSLGGIMTALAAGMDGTFYKVVPILAGGDVAAITFHARETRQIRQACEAKGITQEKLAEMLKPVEPLSFANRIDPRTCLMINAAEDEVIPPETTAALRKAIGDPKQIVIPGVGHYKAVLYFPSIRQKVIDYIVGKGTNVP